MSESVVAEGLREQLDRWVAEGLITREQAARIEAKAHEDQPAVANLPRLISSAAGPAAPAAVRRVPLVVEGLGYLGGMLAAVAGFIALRELWPDISTAGEMAFAAAATVLLLGVGAAVRAGHDPAFDRLRGVLWVLSTASLTAFTALLVNDLWDLSAAGATLLTATVATAYSVVLWLRTDSPIQQLATFAGLAVMAGSGAAWLDADLVPWSAGLAVWLLSAVWGVAAHRGRIGPRGTGYVAAAIGLLIGAQLTMQTAAGNALALASVAGVLAAGVLLSRVWLLGIGAVGVTQIVPQTAVRYLPPSVGAPLALFAIGLVLLGTALWLAHRRTAPRRDRRPDGVPGGARPG